MWVRVKKAQNTVLLPLVLSVALIFASFLGARHTSADAQIGAAIDLYTLKAPFDGKGANLSSDAFEPQELVVLQALVTYNEGPQCSMDVAFQVEGPPNPFENFTAVGSGRTNEAGRTEFAFRLPWPCQKPEEIVFGEWVAIATVNIASRVVVDVLTFRVGWIIRIAEIATLDSQLKPQSIFARDDPIIFNLTVENIARAAKSATIKIDVKDSMDKPIIHIQMEDALFQAGQTTVQALSLIPVSAQIGMANVSAAPFTAPPESGGRLYSPAIYTTFQITVRDIAITDVKLSSNSVFVGDILAINVTVLNKGNMSETFDLSTYYDSSLIEDRHVEELAPLTKETFAFNWNTASMEPGLYQISASAPLLGDANPSDNTYVDGMVEIKTRVPSEVIHDVAVVDVVPWPRIINSGEIVSINVTLKNKGTMAESFYVTVFYDRASVDRKYVANLLPSTEMRMMFEWNTSGVFPMNYVIIAVADRVEGETNVEDNTFIDGTVTIWPYPPFFPTLDWLIIWIIVIIAGIAGIVLLFLIFALDRLRRRRKGPRPSYTVIVHPHI